MRASAILPVSWFTSAMRDRDDDNVLVLECGKRCDTDSASEDDIDAAHHTTAIDVVPP
jgi:hypothetical protein